MPRVLRRSSSFWEPKGRSLFLDFGLWALHVQGLNLVDELAKRRAKDQEWEDQPLIGSVESMAPLLHEIEQGRTFANICLNNEHSPENLKP